MKLVTSKQKDLMLKLGLTIDTHETCKSAFLKIGRELSKRKEATSIRLADRYWSKIEQDYGLSPEDVIPNL